MFKGSYVALVTPFKKDGTIDENKVRELVNYHIENGTSGISPCGTTGESPTLTYEEHKKMIKIVVEEAKGRIHILAGAGSNSTREAIEFTKFAKEVGADSVLSVCPYYNKPTQEGIYAHYEAISKEVDIPIVVYNVPGRSGVNILPETIAKLAELKNIKGVKEAGGSVDQVCEIIDLCGDKIDVLSGDDALTLPMLSVGAKGVVSVTANFMAKEVSDMIKYFENGEIKKAQELHKKLFRVHKTMFIETNPVPVKATMEMLGKISGDVRLPLVRLKDKNKEILTKVLKNVEII
ncbi:4-hydroxy-tetrahydrodipicolinate synthase [Haliovirga abyssi]|uniref:4-hydroxy-tetrahydrodipicolinate synthase n=1 Tax=Haliovirga abyssi TaxID=2996794 RepID=A0AAU9DDD5_9FUSO|nr:4-hydroxy-tetrahydrodipicolinate synthase [Haliovirga abyssi]BDU50183.1 4-hydroxy-tetrahydrodipicolinate synthase [Haliovirga abyssi]